jgi:DNA-binding NarL/FixJ family response regulator
MAIRVLIADDNRLVRKGLCAVLEGAADIEVVEEAPNTHALALSGHSDRQLVGRMLAAGEVFLSPQVAGIVLDRYVRHGQGEVPEKAAALTPRQREVLQFIAEGRHTKQIAHELDISPKNVQTHRRNVKRRPGVDSWPSIRNTRSAKV